MAEQDPFKLDNMDLSPEERLLQRRELNAIDKDMAARTRLAFYKEGVGDLLDNNVIDEARERLTHLMGTSATKLFTEIDPELQYANLMPVAELEEYEGVVLFMKQRRLRYVEKKIAGWMLNNCEPLPLSHPFLGRNGVTYAITPDSNFKLLPVDVSRLSVEQILEFERGILHEVHFYETIQRSNSI